MPAARSPSTSARHRARGALPRGQRRDGELIAAYGSRNGYNFAMVSRDDSRDARVAREALPVGI